MGARHGLSQVLKTLLRRCAEFLALCFVKFTVRAIDLGDEVMQYLFPGQPLIS